MRDGLVEGGDALAQGFYSGFTGLVTKPLQGARTGVGGKSWYLAIHKGHSRLSELWLIDVVEQIGHPHPGIFLRCQSGRLQSMVGAAP